MKKQLMLCGALIFAVLPVSGIAQDKFSVPDGCIAKATIHKNMCHLTTVMDCGSNWSAVTFANGQPAVIHEYSNEGQLIRFRYADEQSIQMIAVPETGSNMDLNTAIEMGSVDESGEFLFSTRIIQNRKYFLDGRIEFSGETVDLNGVTFQKGRIFRVFELEPGKGGLEFEIDVFVAPEENLFFEASWQRSIMGNNVETFDHAPIAVYFPGEDGFLVTKPESGCK